MAKEGMIDWDDETIRDDSGGSGEIRKLWIRAGQTERILLIEKQVFMVLTHYSRTARQYGRCIKGHDPKGCPGCVVFGDPKQRFGTNVVVFKTDKQGKLIKPVEWEIQLWTFGSDKFATLREKRQEWGDLRKHDLKLYAKDDRDEKFQSLNITVCKEAVWLKNEKLREAIIASYKDDKFDVKAIMGKIYSYDEFIDKMQIDTSKLEQVADEELDLEDSDKTSGFDDELDEDEKPKRKDKGKPAESARSEIPEDEVLSEDELEDILKDL